MKDFPLLKTVHVFPWGVCVQLNAAAEEVLQGQKGVLSIPHSWEKLGSVLAPVSSLAFPPHKPKEMKNKSGDIT